MDKQFLYQSGCFPSLNDMLGTSKDVTVIAGPCAIESGMNLEYIVERLKRKKVRIIRGGAYKPRTSPYDFQGLGIEALRDLSTLCKKHALLCVSEILDTRYVEDALKYIDIIQIGSRNMHNTALLKEVGRTGHPVILKRGMMSTLREFLLAAEYIVSQGNQRIIMCERGIRTFEDSTRNTLDISSIAIIKQETSLPIIVDLSHSLGRKDIIVPVGKALFALGVNGIMLEVHSDPSRALSDAQQQLSLQEFDAVYDALFEKKRIARG